MGECIVRNRPQDIDNFYGWAVNDVSYIIADCLVGKATECGGRHRFGAFLLDAEDALDTDLNAWLDGSDLPEAERGVTMIALGSQSALTTLSMSAEADLLTGCLEASPRVLIASKVLPDDPVLKKAVETGRLRAMAYLPQRAALKHGNVRCFVSHGGANSVHEALASGTAVVPLPFFDDQFYIAMRCEDIYDYVAMAMLTGETNYAPLRKAMLRTG